MAEALREWLTVNQSLIYFIYGQAFFITGLAIALQTRRSSRLQLSRTLRWLAGFGMIHGFHEWGELFIPIQAKFLSTVAIDILKSIDVLLLAVSLAFLFQFGIALVKASDSKNMWMHFVVPVMFFLWLNASFGFGLFYPNSSIDRQAIANAFARYLLGFPGALVAAYGLCFHTQQQITPFNLPHIYRYLQRAGLTLGVYAILAGLVVPYVPFFPGNWLNSDTFAQIFVAPVPIFRSIIGMLLAVFIIRALEIFEVENNRLIEQMEQEQVVALERERIGRELHDGAIQQVYAAGLMAEALRKHGDEKFVKKLDRLILSLNQAITDMRQFLVVLRPGSEPLNPAMALLPVVTTAEQAFGTTIQVNWQPENLPLLAPGTVSHLVSFTREALSNAVRHAKATQIEVALTQEETILLLRIRDNGSGLPSELQRGFGLRNMRDRARMLGGDVQLQSTDGKGTTVILSLPLEKT
jgi:signal transduction histidine kinase